MNANELIIGFWIIIHLMGCMCKYCASMQAWHGRKKLTRISHKRIQYRGFVPQFAIYQRSLASTSIAFWWLIPETTAPPPPKNKYCCFGLSLMAVSIGVSGTPCDWLPKKRIAYQKNASHTEKTDNKVGKATVS